MSLPFLSTYSNPTWTFCEHLRNTSHELRVHLSGREFVWHEPCHRFNLQGHLVLFHSCWCDLKKNKSDQKHLGRRKDLFPLTILYHSLSWKEVKARCHVRNLKTGRLTIPYSITSDQGTPFTAKKWEAGTIESAAFCLNCRLVLS